MMSSTHHESSKDTIFPPQAQQVNPSLYNATTARTTHARPSLPPENGKPKLEPPTLSKPFVNKDLRETGRGLVSAQVDRSKHASTKVGHIPQANDAWYKGLEEKVEAYSRIGVLAQKILDATPGEVPRIATHYRSITPTSVDQSSERSIMKNDHRGYAQARSTTRVTEIHKRHSSKQSEIASREHPGPVSKDAAQLKKFLQQHRQNTLSGLKPGHLSSELKPVMNALAEAEKLFDRSAAAGHFITPEERMALAAQPKKGQTPLQDITTAMHHHADDVTPVPTSTQTHASLPHAAHSYKTPRVKDSGSGFYFGYRDKDQDLAATKYNGTPTPWQEHFRAQKKQLASQQLTVNETHYSDRPTKIRRKPVNPQFAQPTVKQLTAPLNQIEHASLAAEFQ